MFCGCAVFLLARKLADVLQGMTEWIIAVGACGCSGSGL